MLDRKYPRKKLKQLKKFENPRKKKIIEHTVCI